MRRLSWLALAALLVPFAAARDDVQKEKEDGFVPLFNGKNLDGWVRVNNAPGTFFVKDGEIITTGKPTGFMRTAKQYENFILEMEWMHVPPKKGEVGNSGLFVWGDPLPALGSPFTRGIEVQVLVNLEYRDKKSGKVTATSHGDLFSIWGAKCVPDRPHPTGAQRCLPSEYRAKGEREWNHYRVVAKDGTIKLSVNGKEVSGVSKCTPRKGYLALEAEGSECHFRNMKIKELPSSKPEEKDVADEAKGFTTLFTGLNLDGWKAGEQKDHWKVGDNVIRYDGKAEGGGVLTSEKECGDVEMVLDVKLPKGGEASLSFGDVSAVDLSKGKPGAWSRFVVTRKGAAASAKVDGKEFSLSKIEAGKSAITLKSKSAVELMNLFVRELK
jgi:hypothetical protein